ncbi:unnamed protein product [Rhizopus stolonifer]
MIKLQSRVKYIFIKHLIDVKTDIFQDGGWDKWLLVENKTIVSFPDISQSDNDNKIRRIPGLLTITNVVEVEVEEEVADISNGNCRPQKFRNNPLPDKSLRRKIEQKMINRISYQGADDTQGGQVNI